MSNAWKPESVVFSVRIGGLLMLIMVLIMVRHKEVLVLGSRLSGDTSGRHLDCHRETTLSDLTCLCKFGSILSPTIGSQNQF